MKQLKPASFGPAVAPFAHGVETDQFVFVAGQVAFDGENKPMAIGDVRRQTEITLDRIDAVLAEAGCSLADLVTTTVYLADLDDFAEFNAGWTEKIGSSRPTRATVQARLALPELLVEIQATAVKPKGDA